MKKIFVGLLVMVMLLGLVGCKSDKPGTGETKKVTLLTPYLTSVTTNQMAKKMEESMKANGWDVNIIDTNNDMAALASRMEDTISAKVDAIVLISVDPNQIKDQIDKAAAENIIVFGCDSSFVDGMTVNVTSDNEAMSKQITDYLIDEIGGSGNIIVLTHRPHPGVLKRTETLDKLLEENPGINVITEQQVEVPGPIENARKLVENLLLANPADGSIDAIWCGWDEPAIGATQAIEAAGRTGITVTGIDGNSQAVDMIKNGEILKATVEQNFIGMADIVVEQLTKVFNKEEVTVGDHYAPANLITK